MAQVLDVEGIAVRVEGSGAETLLMLHGWPVTLVLHDWGCIFGYQFCMRHPERVRRIVGVDIGDAESLPRTLSLPQMAGVAGYQLWLAVAWKIGGGLGDRMTRWMARLVRAPADCSSTAAASPFPSMARPGPRRWRSVPAAGWKRSTPAIG